MTLMRQIARLYWVQSRSNAEDPRADRLSTVLSRVNDPLKLSLAKPLRHRSTVHGSNSLRDLQVQYLSHNARRFAAPCSASLRSATCSAAHVQRGMNCSP